MVIDTPINPTQLAGLLAFGTAGVAALYAAHNAVSTGQPTARQWRWVCIFQIIFCIEIWLGARHAMHDVVNSWLRELGIYQDRATLQKWMLMTIAACGAITGFAWLRTVMQTRKTFVLGKLAIACTAAVVLLFLMETVSLHAIDRVIYREVGPVLLIAYAWIANAATVTGLAWRSVLSRD